MRRTSLFAFAAALLLAPLARSQTTGLPANQGAGEPVTAEVKQKVLDGLQDVIVNKAFVPAVDFKKWPEYVEKHKGDLDKAETDTAFARELNRTLSEFGISHIRLRAPRAAQARVRTSTFGFGISVRKDEKGLTILQIAPDSPGTNAGLKVGEMITEVDGKPATDAAQLRIEADAPAPGTAPPAKTLAMKVQSTDGKVRDVTLTAKSISTLRPPTLTWVGTDAAVLKITTFSLGYDRLVIEKELSDAAKAKYLIIDLRNDGGGAVRNLDHLLNLLLPEGTEYGVHVRRAFVDDYLKETHASTADPVEVARWEKTKQKTRKGAVEPYKGKIAVLINRGSASASEIVAAALHDTVGAPLVGQPSRGAVLASVYAKLEGGFELQYPISDYVTIKNVRLEANPLQPDVAVTARPEEGKPDPVVEAAITKLKGS